MPSTTHTTPIPKHRKSGAFRRVQAVRQALEAAPSYVSLAELCSIAYDGNPPATAPSHIRSYVTTIRGELPDNRRLIASNTRGYRIVGPHHRDDSECGRVLRALKRGRGGWISMSTLADAAIEGRPVRSADPVVLARGCIMRIRRTLPPTHRIETAYKLGYRLVRIGAVS